MIREALTKELTQLKNENTILEESNARYSKLQLIEAQVFGVPFLFRVAVLSAAANIPAGTGWHSEGAETSGQVAPCARDDP